MTRDDAPYEVCLVEDEAPARELLIDYLLERPELKLGGVAKNGREALSLLSTRRFDLVLMDIRLPGCSGIQVIERMRNVPYVIFITAHDEYALKAFDLGAVDYLLKPFTRERFHLAVDKFLAARRASRGDSVREAALAVRYEGKHYILPFEEIYFCTAHGKRTVVHAASGDYEIPEIMKSLEMRLPATFFVRIHRRHIVNLKFLGSLQYFSGGQYQASLKDGDDTSLPVGRGYAPALKARLGIE